MRKKHTEQLVAKAMNRFIFQNNIRKHQITTPKWLPDIVISRAAGSGGRVIAMKIAKKLDWQLLDKKLMIKLANEHGLPQKEFAKVDEHSRNWISDTINQLFNPSYVSDIRYLKHLKHLLMKAASEGDVVIVGRGANHIIPADKCLRVRITASTSTRINNTYKFEKKSSKEEAARWVTKVEEQRTKFIRQYFGANPNDPKNFDLVVNTDSLTLTQATNLIISAYCAKFPSEHKKLKNKI